MSSSPFSLWVYLASTPLLWLAITLIAWMISDAIARRVHNHPLLNPVLISVIIISFFLLITGTDYGTYFAGAQFVHFLLGPATVAIGVPLINNLSLVRQNLVPLLAALVVGGVTGVVSVILLCELLGLPHDMVATMAPKSVTAAVAMGISEQVGGNASLTGIIVIITGVLGAIIVTPLMNVLRIKDFVGRGLAAGLASHGIGTARAFSVDPVAGTFAGIAMGMNAVITAFLVPPIINMML